MHSGYTGLGDHYSITIKCSLALIFFPESCIEAGWGRLDDATPSSVLMYADVPIQPSEYCEAAYGSPHDPNALCGGYMEGGIGFCEVRACHYEYTVLPSLSTSYSYPEPVVSYALPFPSKATKIDNFPRFAFLFFTTRETKQNYHQAYTRKRLVEHNKMSMTASNRTTQLTKCMDTVPNY